MPPVVHKRASAEELDPTSSHATVFPDGPVTAPYRDCPPAPKLANAVPAESVTKNAAFPERKLGEQPMVRTFEALYPERNTPGDITIRAPVPDAVWIVAPVIVPDVSVPMLAVMSDRLVTLMSVAVIR